LDINIKENKNIGQKNLENSLKKSVKKTPPLKKEKTRNLKPIKLENKRYSEFK
tara:strand:+ start:388 stop:546 length:159 start_codon:yes stop_codon:yes gene_type:complete